MGNNLQITCMDSWVTLDSWVKSYSIIELAIKTAKDKKESSFNITVG